MDLQKGIGWGGDLGGSRGLDLHYAGPVMVPVQPTAIPPAAPIHLVLGLADYAGVLNGKKGISSGQTPLRAPYLL